MRRMYSATFTDVAVTADQDFFQIEAVTVPALLHACYISQNTDFGDAAAEILTLQIRRVTDTITAGPTEVKLDERDAQALADVAINDVTPLTTSPQILHAECWNIALPWIWLPPPELRVWVPVDDTVCITLVADPNDSITCSGTLYWEEAA